MPTEPHNHRYWRTDAATGVVLVIVLAMLLGVSPGLALVAVAVAVLLLDAYAPEVVDPFI